MIFLVQILTKLIRIRILRTKISLFLFVPVKTNKTGKINFSNYIKIKNKRRKNIYFTIEIKKRGG